MATKTPYRFEVTISGVWSAFMELLYFATPEGNFGDDLNTWLWDDLLPGWRAWSAPGHLVGVGTVLKRGFLPEGPKLVLGSGVGYGTPPDIAADGPWDIRAVRGPRTAAALALPADRAIVDPAAMIPRLPDFADVPRGDEVVFVPHYKSVPQYDWPAICARAGVAYQSPSADSRAVIRRLAAARAVIAESMHAAIIADAFGTPWRGVAVTRSFNRFKWGDWAESLDLPAPEITEFFGPLRRVQRALGRRGAAAPAPVPGPATAPAPGPSEAARSRLTPVLERWAAGSLGREARKPFALSDRAALARAQDRFADMLSGVAASYG